ncbi:MAG: peptidoglycan-binding protein LysM [Scandinavium sp.]|uniref:peptidoglycan-binding protein LysM n=1 Tax=Scandinavium sp. TaxID=2830653 RepID=UPI003F313F93
MGLINFIKEAGEKLFHTDNSNSEKAEKIKAHINTLNVPGASNINVNIDDSGVASLSGNADTQQTADKLVVAAGNIEGISDVNNALTVSAPALTAQYYTVQSGDTLSAISRRYYGSANHYQAIFESNQPMLSHPDSIYPGQKLIIPELVTKQ